MRQSNRGFELFKSEVIPVADPVTLIVRGDFAHCFAGVRFFSDAGGVTSVTPGAGTVAVDVETIVNQGVFEDLASGGSITATAPTTVGWDGNTRSVRATPSGVTGATHYQLIVSQNRC